MIAMGVLAAANQVVAPGGGGGGAYPPFANMVAGLHFDGADGSSTFTDVTGNVWSVLGSPAPEIDTAQSVFGGASGYFPGGTNYLEHSGGSRYAYGTGDFCWAGWVRLSTIAGNQYILDHNGNGGLISYESNMLHYYNVGTGLGALYYTNTPLTVNTWHYIEASRVAGITYLFKDGALVASQADTYNYPNATLRFGVFGGGGNNLNGAHLDDWGIWKGVGGHTASYTPPPSPFPNG